MSNPSQANNHAVLQVPAGGHMAAAMTARDLQELLVTMLTREGGNRRRWRIVVGDVRVYSLSTHPRCNWSITPDGNAGEVARVERLLDTLRLSHPIVQ